MRRTIDYGIDLGTTNSALARQDGARALLLDDGTGVLLPSAVHVRPDGSVIVGAAARALFDVDPANTSVEFKRLMGSDEPRRFAASGRSMQPEALSAEVLKALVARAKEEVRACVITIPAMFQLPQCEATTRAAKLAGIEVAPLLHEPIAAAIAHAGDGHTGDGCWLVYDLGGGTFDVSLVRCRSGRLQVLDHDGDNHLGGRDLDRVIAQRAAENVRADGRLGAFRRADPANADAFARLKSESERVRVALSEATSATFRVDGLSAAGKAIDLQFDVTRGELESMIEPLVSRTVQLCTQLLGRNRIENDSLRGLVLVGGPTRTPLVPRMLEESLGVEVSHRHDPMTIVATGAALFASTQKVPPEVRRRGRSEVPQVEFELEYEPMTSDPAPLLVIHGQPAADAANARARVVRADGGFDSDEFRLDAGGTAAIVLSLEPFAMNRFTVTTTLRDCERQESSFAIHHGLSLAKPPLSQSVGVMLEGNRACWYLRKGAPLPARNTMVHTTTISLLRGDAGEAVHVPIIQGESDRADRNKVIGVLRIYANRISRDMPAGSDVEVHVVVDESLHTSARAYVPLLDQWFDDVALLCNESKNAGQLKRDLDSQRKRIEELSKLADDLGTGDGTGDERVKEIETLLDDGDTDSVDSADAILRRMMRDLDVVEGKNAKEGLEQRFAEVFARAVSLLEEHATPSERAQFMALVEEFTEAISRDDLDIASEKFEAIDDLENSILFRIPEFWFSQFGWLSQRIIELGLQRQYADALSRGRKAVEANDFHEIRPIVRELYGALPRTAAAIPAAVKTLAHLQ